MTILNLEQCRVTGSYALYSLGASITNNSLHTLWLQEHIMAKAAVVLPTSSCKAL